MFSLHTYPVNVLLWSLYVFVITHWRCNMAAIAFDPLGYTHELEAAGVPRAQAEVHAKAMTVNFRHNFDALVTTDYMSVRFSEFETRFSEFETRFSEFETRVNANMDRRFAAVDKQFATMDKQFYELQSSMDKQFVAVAHRFDGLELRFEKIDSQFSKIYLLFGITLAAITIPILQNFLG